MITIVGQPDSVNPAYNPTVYYVDSTNKNQPAFRYIVQILDYPSGSLLAELKIAPRPGDGYGYVDISKIVQSQVLNALEINNTTYYNADDSSVYYYDIYFGEEYIQTWPFDDYQYNSTQQYLGLVDLVNFTPVTSPYVVGDQVLVKLNAVYNDFRDNLNGYFTVLDPTPSAAFITLNNAFPGAAGLTPGTVQYADGRKYRDFPLNAVAKRVVFNAAYSFVDYQSYDESTVIMGNPLLSQILSSAPETDYRAKTYQYLFWNFFDGGLGLVDYIVFTNSNGDVLEKSVSGPLSLMKGVPCGPANHGTLTVVSGTLPLIKPNTTSYTVHARDSAGNILCLAKEVFIDQSCSINDCQILFMDRRGSWSSLPFSLRQRSTITATRTAFRQELGNLGDGPSPTQWGYQLGDAGLTTTGVDYETKWTLNTDYLTNGMSAYYAELITSPELYVQLESGGPFLRCVVVDTAYEIQTTNNKKLIKNVLTIQLAVDDSINI